MTAINNPVPPIEMPPIRYSKNKSPFYLELTNRVNAYFSDNQISKFANTEMYLRTAGLLVLWLTVYALMFSSLFSGWAFTLLQASFHVIMFVMTVAIAHDGSHNSYHKSPVVNKWVNRVFDVVGINTYLWEYNHIKSHHVAPNIPVYDSAIDSFTLFRFHPMAKHYWFHKYQHLYIFVIYACSTLFKLFFLDFFSLNRNRIGFVEIVKHPTREVVYLFVTRSIVILYTLILPLVFIDLPVGQLLLGFLLGHAISGILIGIIFMTTHLSERTTFPYPDADGVIDNSFDQHIMETTADFSINNRFITFIGGGLNIHVVHHLFPNVCQIHLPELAKIVQQTAKEFDVTYKVYPSAWSALESHMEIMKRLGQNDATLLSPQSRNVLGKSRALQSQESTPPKDKTDNNNCLWNLVFS